MNLRYFWKRTMYLWSWGRNQDEKRITRTRKNIWRRCK